MKTPFFQGFWLARPLLYKGMTSRWTVTIEFHGCTDVRHFDHYANAIGFAHNVESHCGSIADRKAGDFFYRIHDNADRIGDVTLAYK